MRTSTKSRVIFLGVLITGLLSLLSLGLDHYQYKVLSDVVFVLGSISFSIIFTIIVAFTVEYLPMFREGEQDEA